MNKLVSLLLLAALPYLFSQSLKSEDLGVYVTRTSLLFASNVSDFDHLDLANMRAVYAPGQWQALKHGRGKTIERNRSGNSFLGSTQAWLRGRQSLDADHQLAVYSWEWVGGSSSQSVLVQVLELRGESVFITQRIEAEAHGLGAGARFDPRNKLLTVKAVGFAEGDARGAPSFLGVVTFRWDGKQFHRVSGRKAPLPKSN
jgi:hypothetical protein